MCISALGDGTEVRSALSVPCKLEASRVKVVNVDRELQCRVGCGVQGDVEGLKQVLDTGRVHVDSKDQVSILI